MTNKLSERRWRAPNYEAESRALHSLGRHVTASPQALFERLVNITLNLCEAGSAGLSLIEKQGDGTEIFRWVATAGAYASLKGGQTPRENSPCGVCLSRGSPQLYERLERYFTQLAGLEPVVVEALIVPIYVKSRPVGTIWIVSHTPERRFDREDVRIMESIVGFIAAAILRADSDRKQKKAEQLNRAILMNSPDCIKVLDAEGRIIFLNDNGLKLLGTKDPTAVLNKVWAELWDDDQKPRVKDAVAAARKGKATRFQAPQANFLGARKWWDVFVSRLPVDPEQVLVISKDITSQRRADDQIRKAKTELEDHARNLEVRVADRTGELQGLNNQLQKLSRKLLKSEEEERRHIAKELHDELGQKLTGLKLLLEGMPIVDQAESDMERARLEVANLMRQVRTLSFDLRQGLPDHINLKTALSQHFEKLKRDKAVSVRFKCNDDLNTLSRETTITIYRLVQEALTNVIRHSGTSHARVTLGAANDRIQLSISDQGIGFRTEKTRDGIGLKGMRERVLLCGGKFELKTQPDAGTRVEVEIPLRTE